MYARITRLVCLPGSDDDIRRSFSNQTQPMFSAMRGYRGMIAHFEAATSVAIIITYWDTQHQAESFGASSQRHDLMDRLQPLLRDVPRSEVMALQHTDVGGFPTYRSST
jgi:heme-degrading monooxygenase HmoA